MFFFRQWAAAPFRTAALAPSGKTLTKIITQEIGPGTGSVVEFGPGTGVFTAALRARGIAEQNLTLIELNPKFAVLLSRRFPAARVLQVNAAELYTKALLADSSAGAIVSGIGFPTMSLAQITNVFLGAFRCLRPDGAFYQFTYFPFCPVPAIVLARVGLKAERIGGTLRNFPPASVYRITRAQPGPQTLLPFLTASV